MPICRQCNAEVPDNGFFCPVCGTRLDATTAVDTESGPGVGPPPGSGTPGEPVRFIPGTIIDGRYRIIGLLGRGGMGEVYRADDLKLGQPVALKFLPSEVEHDAERLERFLNEVRTALKVTHANVCRVHDIGEVDGQHYLSMEYVDGEDLGSLLRRIGRLPGDKALQIARQLCAGLAAAHDQGIIHRDLKPANVMIDGRGRAKITDFGLAGLAETIEGDEVRVGTPLYMAPEQARGEQVTVRSDIYSLGLVLYELFTGHRAYEGVAPTELQSLREESTPTSPSHHVEGLDPVVECTILRCLETDPSGRPPSALAVAAALPGGDPLAAALAAGETPSPEMVADAGGAGGLRPAIAVPLLVFVVLSLVVVGAIRDRFAVEGMVSLPKPPEALVVEAREIIEAAGHAGHAVDRAHGFIYDDDYMDFVAAQEPTADRWDGLSTVRPAPIRFWYRESPEHLVAADHFTGDESRYVSPDEPPWTVGAMAGVWLDPEGRLLRLKAVPPPYEAASAVAAPVDWSIFFEAAGFDAADFSPSAPIRNPLLTCDEQLAWEGDDPEAGPIRIEACTYGGKPAHFEVVPKWREKPSDHFATPAVLWDELFLVSLLIAVVVGGGLLARRNLRLGRGDRRGALRMASFIFILSAVAWLLQAHHVWAFSEVYLFFNFLGYGLVVSGLTWMVYIALEPYARRMWPQGLIAWNRLLSGRIRDPLVGRDMLIGAAFGACTVCWWGLNFLIVDSLSLVPERPRAASLDGLTGIGPTIGQCCENVVTAIYMPVAWLFAVLLLRFLLRRQWIAVLVLLVWAVGTWIPGHPSPVLFTPFALVAFGGFLFVILKFGLLSGIFWGLYMWPASYVIFTLDTSAWYAGRSFFVMLLLAALAGYAFWISLAGRPLVRADVLES